MNVPDVGQRKGAGRAAPADHREQVVTGARAVARRFLSVMSPPPRAEDVDSVLLVVSELVTNAVRHAGGLTGFRLRAVTPDAVEVAVQDASPRPPRPRPLDPHTPGGFGLHLVHGLAHSVRTGPGPRGGKTVTAVVPCAREAPARRAPGGTGRGSPVPGGPLAGGPVVSGR
ncbi:ATP-binding protein [Streptomyces hoynatensis]|uniref:ATP-binding protein n=1 Tax=Streptomyces hoynatensis TaxID=1141874 RepID=A0A3A9ZDR2_9ACTN|nr:ATP-binding protein [Streptomyces hoynatensis]RKN45884.1 ATP-binding protein [Streptomyces hoynatensis]